MSLKVIRGHLQEDTSYLSSPLDPEQWVESVVCYRSKSGLKGEHHLVHQLILVGWQIPVLMDMRPEIVQSDSNCDLLWFYLFFPYFPFFSVCVNLHNLIWDHCSKTISPNVSMFSSIEIFIIDSTEFKTMRPNHSTPIDMWRVKQVFVLEMSSWVLWNLIILEAYLHPNGTVVSKDSCSFAEFIKILI